MSLSSKINKRFNTLVIAGGASKCISVIGALHNLVEKLDYIKNYAGTSAGGIICYLLAIGYTPFEMIQFICASNFIDEFQNLNIMGVIEQKGLVNYCIIQDYFEKLTLNKIGYLPTFADIRNKMNKNLTLVTYNLTKNEPEYINADTYPQMPCLTALRMTVNVPLLFERFFYNSYEYLDGGLVDNFPIDYYSGPEYEILGININPVEISSSKKQNYVMYLLKIAMIPYIFFSLKKKFPLNSTVISLKPDVQAFDFNLNLSKRLNLFSYGYKTVLDFENTQDTVKENDTESEESTETDEGHESEESIEEDESEESTESDESDNIIMEHIEEEMKDIFK